jgi:hypothetical protein
MVCLGKQRRKKMLDGYHKMYKFDNGYGASVVSNNFSYGGDRGFFEVAVLDAAGNITYDTPITGDVLGYLDFDGVAKTLREIQNLPTFAKVDA